MFFIIPDKSLKNLLCMAKLVPQSPTRACVKCYDQAAPDYNTRWLPWLECAQPYDHSNEERMTLIVGDDHEVVEVLELPSGLTDRHPSTLTLCQKARQRGGCLDGYYCNSPHRKEELEYWKWTIVHKHLKKVWFIKCFLITILFTYPSNRFPTMIPSVRSTATHLMRLC